MMDWGKHHPPVEQVRCQPNMAGERYKRNDRRPWPVAALSDAPGKAREARRPTRGNPEKIAGANVNNYDRKLPDSDLAFYHANIFLYPGQFRIAAPHRILS
jgi:hypothetical protein